MKTRGLSLTELLVTLMLVGVAAGVLLVGYGNLRDMAQGVAQDKDQTALYQALSTFRLMGGNIAPILNLANEEDRAAALTLVMQEQVSASARKQGGQVGQLIGENMVLVPYNAKDGRARLVVNDTRTSLDVVIPKKGQKADGFIVASDSHVNPTLGDISKNAMTAVTQVLGSNGLAGARYADNSRVRQASQYVWNEDATLRGGPDETVRQPTGPGGTRVPTPTALRYRMYFNDAVTFTGYTQPDDYRDLNPEKNIGKGWKMFEFYKENGDPLGAGELDLSKISLGGRSVMGGTVGKGYIVREEQTGPKTQVVRLYIRMNDIYPASDWTQDTAQILLKVKPSDAGLRGSADRAPLAPKGLDELLLVKAAPEDLSEPSIAPSRDTLQSGDVVVVEPVVPSAVPSGWLGVNVDTPTLDSGSGSFWEDFFTWLGGLGQRVEIRRK